MMLSEKLYKKKTKKNKRYCMGGDHHHNMCGTLFRLINQLINEPVTQYKLVETEKKVWMPKITHTSE